MRMALYGLLTCCTSLLKHRHADQVSSDERADLLARILVLLQAIDINRKELIEMWDATKEDK